MTYILIPILWLTVLSSSSSSSLNPSSIAKPNCAEKCGGVSIPYPFGMGPNPNCFHNSFYEIFCNHSFKPSKPFLQYYNLEVIEITWQFSSIFYSFLKKESGVYYSYPQTLTVLAPPTNMCEIKDSAPLLGLDFAGSPFRFSNAYNDFLVEGCSGHVVIRNRNRQIVSGCSSVCVHPNSTINSTTCHGAGCCLSSLSDSDEGIIGSDFYEIAVDHLRPTTNSCTLAATLISNDDYFSQTGNLSLSTEYPTVLQWYLTTGSLHLHMVDCVYADGVIQMCRCKYPYQGNPYLPHGCQVIEDCQKCIHHCAFNATGQNFYCQKTSSLNQPLILGLGTSIGLVLVILGCYLLYRLIKWRREVSKKAEFFKKNGGLLLQQQMSSNDGVVEKMTVFTVSELEKATDNFHEDRVLGQGGQGTVYKGMLMDGRLVAIKKSTKVEENQLDQFINEVVILSQINHRNVVKLLGCCLETEVPLLVYEFIQNGTLYQHIHDLNEDFHVSWKMRLQIAADSAEALAYLHSSLYAPIYHRDIKSSNILLDDKFRAKIADFGTSRAINIEQTHVTTRVQGTYGYLDPEYFQSNQFTEKSDVYSFGVVLVEFITGQKPVFPTECGEWKSLALEFLSQMERSCLFDIVDTRVVEEGKKEEFIAVAELAKRCLNTKGKQRPTMKEVATVLDGIRSPNSKSQIV